MGNSFFIPTFSASFFSFNTYWIQRGTVDFLVSQVPAWRASYNLRLPVFCRLDRSLNHINYSFMFHFGISQFSFPSLISNFRLNGMYVQLLVGGTHVCHPNFCLPSNVSATYFSLFALQFRLLHSCFYARMHSCTISYLRMCYTSLLHFGSFFWYQSQN